MQHRKKFLFVKSVLYDILMFQSLYIRAGINVVGWRFMALFFYGVSARISGVLRPDNGGLATKTKTNTEAATKEAK